MPQLFQVLRCYKCLVFQGHQTKKANKFACKMCGEKQSIKRHYGLGTAQECRFQVQKLNSIRGEINEMKTNVKCESDNHDGDHEIKLEQVNSFINNNGESLGQSKWSNFIEKDKGPIIDTNDTMFLNNTEVVLELPQKRRKVFQSTKLIKHFNSNQPLEQNDEDLYSINTSPRHSNPLNVDLKSSGEDIIIMENTQLEIKEVIRPKVPKFEPPIKSSNINKNSKWAQYEEDSNEELNKDRKELSQNKGNKIFSQCEDSDLDNVLNL